MQIYEIISEASTPTLRNQGGKWNWIAPDGSILGTFSSSKEAQDWAKANPAKLNPVTPPARSTPKGKSDLSKLLRSLWIEYRKSNRKPVDKDSVNLVKDFFFKRHNILEKGTYIDFGKTKLGMISGTGLRILQITGYVQFFLDYYAQIKFADDNLQSEENPEGLTPEEAKNFKNAALGELVLKIAASKVLANAVRSLLFVRWIFNIVGLGAAVTSGGLAIPLIIASEVAQQFLMRWINSEEGKRTIASWMAETVLGVEIESYVTAGGAFITGSTDVLVNLFKRAVSLAKSDPKAKPVVDPDKGTIERPSNKPDSDKGQSARPDNTQSNSEKSKTDKYSQYTDDPELKKALQDAGL